MRNLVTSSAQRAIAVDGLIAGRSKELADEWLILLGFCFILALVCAVVTIRITRESVRRVEEQASELGRVSWHMLQTQEEAARRFSMSFTMSWDKVSQPFARTLAQLDLPISTRVVPIASTWLTRLSPTFASCRNCFGR